MAAADYRDRHARVAPIGQLSIPGLDKATSITLYGNKP
jgi:hypothetical protein